jgi:SOS-response transcriptional repressor LexA
VPETPTPRQEQILDFISDFRRRHDRSPTVREIGLHHGIRSPNGVVCHLDALEKKGLIERESMIARSIRPLTERLASGVPTAIVHAGRIVLDTGSGMVGLTPDQAMELAVELVRRARALRAEFTQSSEEATGGSPP